MARYSEQMLDFLRAEYRTRRLPALTDAFNARFGTDKTPKQIKSTLHNHGIRSGRKPGFAKGESLRLFTHEQMQWVRDAYTHLSLADMTAAFNRVFDDNKTVGQLRSFTRNHRIKSGRTGKFEAGHNTWNKGMKGLHIGGEATQFKPGHVPVNTRPLYSERIDAKDGYVFIKVPDPNPHTGASARYVLKHIWLWEQAHGPVPDGYVVSFINGDRRDIRLDNLELLSRGALAIMNKAGTSKMPAELRPTMRAVAKLQDAVCRAQRGME